MAAGTFFQLQLAVSKAEILFRVLEERLNAPAHPVRANYVCGRCVNLVRGEVLDRILFIVFVCFFFGNDQLHVSEFGDGKLLRPDVIEVVINFALNRVDALAERIDTIEREVDDDLYHIWTKKLPVSELGDVKLIIAEKETDDEDKDNPVKYLATNKVDAIRL